MSETKVYDIAIIGAGIVGLATALKLSETPGLKIIILEAEEKIASHQTGNNSGVIHSGLYYAPGSLKAKNCVSGRDAMYMFCENNDVKHERCGKLVVATNQAELKMLNTLYQRGLSNELKGLRQLSAQEMLEYEPHVKGVGALLVPETGIVNYTDVCNAFLRRIIHAENEILLGAKLLKLRRKSPLVLETGKGEFLAKNLVNCAGLQSDRVAKLCGVSPGMRIVPFRGEYYELVPDKKHLVNNLIYPVPNPRFPFLGVHFTRMINGGVEAGPNAVLAFKREGYTKSSFNLKDTLGTFLYPGFWPLAIRHGYTGIGEFYRSFSKKAFVRALQKLVPEISMADIEPAGAGVRAQALALNGKLVDDFRIKQTKNMIHVLNAPSPAATASISIGSLIAKAALKSFDLGKNE